VYLQAPLKTALSRSDGVVFKTAIDGNGNPISEWFEEDGALIFKPALREGK
jgi:hypothetical protein